MRRSLQAWLHRVKMGEVSEQISGSDPDVYSNRSHCGFPREGCLDNLRLGRAVLLTAPCAWGTVVPAIRVSFGSDRQSHMLRLEY